MKASKIISMLLPTFFVLFTNSILRNMHDKSSSYTVEAVNSKIEAIASEEYMVGDTVYIYYTEYSVWSIAEDPWTLRKIKLGDEYAITMWGEKVPFVYKKGIITEIN